MHNRMTIKLKLAFVFIAVSAQCHSQKMVRYNLAEMLTEKKLVVDTSNHAQVLHSDNYKGAISTQKIAWLKNVSFNEGTIDVDLRGKDVFYKVSWALPFMQKVQSITK